ncbi:MAG: hypothetical protein U1E38_05725 [Rhodospirillales bacterium]
MAAVGWKEAAGIVLLGVLFTAGACSTSDSAAERAYSDSTAACERMTNTDQRQSCFEAAMKKYQASKAAANASTCPKASC